MNNQCRRIILLAIYKKDDHLTIAIIGSMVRTGTVGVSQTGNLQVERFHDVEASTGQFIIDRGLNLFAGLIESQKGD
jgi:hypothetical protein